MAQRHRMEAKEPDNHQILMCQPVDKEDQSKSNHPEEDGTTSSTLETRRNQTYHHKEILVVEVAEIEVHLEAEDHQVEEALDHGMDKVTDLGTDKEQWY